MFGRRSDGKELKHVSPIFRLVPSLMKHRDDSQVYFNQDIVITKMEEYISKKAEEGIKISILDLVYAAVVRIIAERPKLNRFVVNGRIYARNKITLAMTIKKSLTDEAEETTVKLDFTGRETVFEIKEKLQAIIAENKDVETENGMDKVAGFLSKIPSGVLKKAVGFLKFLDWHGYLPKSIIEVSPFHASCVVTNVGSLGIDSIYHHIYNFGTTSMFFAIGYLIREQYAFFLRFHTRWSVIATSIAFLLIGTLTEHTMGDNEYSSAPLFVIGALAGSYLTICLSKWIESNPHPVMRKCKNLCCYLSRNSIDIVIWQFVCFRIAIAIQLIVYHLPITDVFGV